MDVCHSAVGKDSFSDLLDSIHIDHLPGSVLDPMIRCVATHKNTLPTSKHIWKKVCIRMAFTLVSAEKYGANFSIWLW